jgi:hypothetical protein
MMLPFAEVAVGIVDSPVHGVSARMPAPRVLMF